ncbi:hypothetical protein [Pseudogulbenkiania sp. MAI-1]|nr:hypothetical protein [Pseudogulbenkiania sp. MAI-1]
MPKPLSRALLRLLPDIAALVFLLPTLAEARLLCLLADSHTREVAA